MKRFLTLLLTLALVLGLAACGTQTTAADPEANSQPEPAETESRTFSPRVTPLPAEEGELPQLSEPGDRPQVTLHTSMGDVTLVLYPEEAPLAVENFLAHCKDGYYDGVKFHRVIQNFMIQSGDPKGDGTGGTSKWGIRFPDELCDGLHHFRGALSMANSGMDTNGSQFFIVQCADKPDETSRESIYAQWMFQELQREYNQASRTSISQEELDQVLAELQAELDAGVTDEYRARYKAAFDAYLELGGYPSLDYGYTVFGFVIEGMDVVDAIAAVEVQESAGGEVSSPVKDVVIKSVTVTE